MKKLFALLAATLACSATFAQTSAPEKLLLRSNGNWDGVEMAVVETENANSKHFHYQGWTSTNRDEGIFINFKDETGSFWGPSDVVQSEDGWVQMHLAQSGEELTDMVSTPGEGGGYIFQAITSMISVDVYFGETGAKVVFKDIATEMCGDAIYLTAEKYNWSRTPDAAHTLAKVADGVYEGTVTITRDDAYFDMVRLYTKPNNGDYDDYIGFSNEGRWTTYAANGKTYKLSSRPAENFRMRRGDTKVRVDFNTGDVTFDYQGEASYVYAVGNVVDHVWARDYSDCKLYETEAGSLVYTGVVDLEGGEVTFFEEGTECSGSWDAGRWGPKEGGKQTAAPEGEWYNGLNRWGDFAWKDIPAGKYTMVLDVANDRFMYKPYETAAITNVTAEADAPIYNLAGVRVSENAKGLLIKGGKKYMK